MGELPRPCARVLVMLLAVFCAGARAETQPFRVGISSAIKAGANHPEVQVVNSWRNRLIGDRQLPVSQRRAATSITIRDDWKLASSGLLGPVRLLKQAAD